MFNTNLKFNNKIQVNKKQISFSKNENETTKYVYLKGPMEKPKDAFIFSLNIAPLWLPQKNMPKVYKTLAGALTLLYGALIFGSPFASFRIEKKENKNKTMNSVAWGTIFKQAFEIGWTGFSLLNCLDDIKQNTHPKHNKHFIVASEVVAGLALFSSVINNVLSFKKHKKEILETNNNA